MNHFHLLCRGIGTGLFALCFLVTSGARAAEGDRPKPLQALLVAGGCCHDYAKQKDILKEGLEKRANVQVAVVYSPDKSTSCRFEMYERADWAKGYDVVIHDECSSDVKETNYVQNILRAHHEGLPAVNLHCAMHSYRTGKDDWFKYLGLQSMSHGPQVPIAITFTDTKHPITHGLTNWTTINEELYNNVKVFEGARPLATGYQVIKKEKDVEWVVAWVNEYGKAKVFSTTLGHNNATVGDGRYLDLVARGLLWSCGKLDDHGKPTAGYGPTR